MRRGGILLAAACLALAARGALVHVCQETLAGGVRTQLRDDILETTEPYTTVSAPDCSGFIFTHWSISTAQPFANRDRLGRAHDAAPFTPYEDTILTANYLPDAQDADGDGVPDGWELYWYGDLAQNAASDTDGDGYTFAEELAAGTNPLLPDAARTGGVAWNAGVLLQYNPHNLQPYTIRSEPAGTLFETVTDYVEPGASVTTPTCDAATTAFAYWTVNGVRQQDRYGRARDGVTFTMPSAAVECVAVTEADDTKRRSLYWYGEAFVSPASDTDGDGYTFAEELAAGTNPLLPDAARAGGVAWNAGDLLETNLQPFEQVQGTVVDEAYAALFSSPTAGTTGERFGANAAPHVVDVDGDGRWDLVVASDAGTRVFLNIGTAGNPMFRETVWNAAWRDRLAAPPPLPDAAQFDTPPVGGVSWAFADVDGDGVDDLLVADADGRIWFYKGVADADELSTRPARYVLQHKVWGGSFGGFAPGLRIAAVDWDDDGDTDLVCSTADGRLMLLNDPRVGRPVNVQAEAGATSVVLTWDPNVNSRVRGYGIYRSADSNDYVQIERLWPLPRYRDTPTTTDDQYYRITGKSRFYVTGNSTPIETESAPTEAVHVQFRPRVWLNDASAFTDTDVEIVVSMNNSMGLAAAGLSLSFAYDPAVLTPVAMNRTGLTDGLTFRTDETPGRWTLTGTGGAIGIGAGRFLGLVFHVKPVHDVTATVVSLVAADVTNAAGASVTLDLPQTATVAIADAHPLEPALVSLAVADASVATGETFALPVTVTSSEALTNGVFTVDWDATALDLVGNTVSAAPDGADVTPRIPPAVLSATGDFTLTFRAKEQHDIAETAVRLTSAEVVGANGFTVRPATPVSGTVLIRDTNPPAPAVAVKMAVSTLDARAESGRAFVVPLGATTDGALATLTATVTWDASLLTFTGAAGAAEQTPGGAAGAAVTLAFPASGTHNLFDLGFTASAITALRTNTTVRVTAAGGMGANGLAATVTTALPVESTVLIVRSIGRYDPGDINGDGKYTDADMTLLQNYIKYQSIVKAAPSLASRYASWKLTGKALKAADVNTDGKVDANDVSMLAQLIVAYKEANK